MKDSIVPVVEEMMMMGNGRLNVVTNMVVQSVHWVDTEKMTCSAWVELGFRYDVRQYLDLFGYGVDAAEADFEMNKGKVLGKDIKFKFNVVNATKLEVRTEAHFFRRGSPSSLAPLYGEHENVVRSVDIAKCKVGDFIKCETYLCDCELVYNSNETYAPFDQLFLSVKIMTDASPGTEMVKFIFDEDQSSFKGMQQSVGSFYPVGDAIINKMQDLDLDVGTVSWDRLYVTSMYRRFRTQGIIKYYALPTLIFIFVVVYRFESVADLLAIGSTLVIADIALLFVAKSNVLTLAEYSVLAQTVMLVIATLVLSNQKGIEDSIGLNNIQIGLLVVDLVISTTTLAYHLALATKANHSAANAVRNGNFAKIDSF